MLKIIARQRGFTLIELAIVLVIIAILIGSFIGTLTTRIENKNIEETKKELEEIKQALVGYAYKNGHLPCPDCIGVLCSPGGFRDGVEDRRTAGALLGSCNVGTTVGTVPWATLALGRGDAWGTRYRYWVHETFSRNGDGIAVDPNKRIFNLSDPQTPADANNPVMARVNDRIADGTATQVIADNVIAVIFSHGKNAYGGISIDDVLRPPIPALPAPGNVDELENTDNDVVNPAVDFMEFVSRPPTPAGATTAGGEFDDIVVWMSEFELKAKMVEAGVLP